LVLIFVYYKVRVFKSKSGVCAAFLTNYDQQYSVKVRFGNGQYDLPPWSISILPDCKTEAFNTAKVRKKTLSALGYIITSFFNKTYFSL